MGLMKAVGSWVFTSAKNTLRTKFLPWLGRYTKIHTIRALKYSALLFTGYQGYIYTDANIGGIALVEGPSMRPTLNNFAVEESWNFDPNKISNIVDTPTKDIVYYEREFVVGRGDIVILQDPKTGGRRIKRVIGVPGDTVTPLTFGNQLGEPLTLKESQFWVESDKAGFGYRDSSLFGPVDQQLIEAKVTLIVGNLSKIYWKTVEPLLPSHAEGRVKVPS